MIGNAYTGQIVLFAGNYVPNGWLHCNGQLVPVSEFQELFAVLQPSTVREAFEIPKLANIGVAQYLICAKGTMPHPPS